MHNHFTDAFRRAIALVKRNPEPEFNVIVHPDVYAEFVADAYLADLLAKRDTARTLDQLDAIGISFDRASDQPASNRYGCDIIGCCRD